MNFEKVPCPCKECDRRTHGCHGKCDDYKKFREFMDKKIEDEHKDTTVKAYRRDEQTKYLRERRRRGGEK